MPPLADDQAFAQQIQVQVERATMRFERAVFALDATLSAPGYQPVSDRQPLGIAPANAVTDGQQTSAGMVLQDSANGITLLVPAAAAPVGVNFHYEATFRADMVTPTVEPTPEPTITLEPKATATPTATVMVTVEPTAIVTSTLMPEATAPVEPVLTPEATPVAPSVPEAAAVVSTTLVNTYYLPVVRHAGDELTKAHLPATALITTPTVITDSEALTALTPITDAGLTFYQIWQLAAVQATQPITLFNHQRLGAGRWVERHG